MNKNLQVKNLGKSYGSKTVIRDVSLEIRQGEVVGLLGPNGAGKTTCFYMIVGLVDVGFGNIFIDEVDITRLPMYQRARLGISYLPQEASIFRGMNVEENIMAVLEISQANEVKRKEMLEKLLEEFSITHIRKSSALALSGGERRRVEIARALATNPSFILLDEPFAGVDPIAVNDIRQMVMHLKDRGIGVLITDHNVRETLSIVDRAYIIYDGKVLTSGTKEEIVENKDVRRVYLGDDFAI
jgi:lipopolysaccharide export system ATP-binding protein